MPSHTTDLSILSLIFLFPRILVYHSNSIYRQFFAWRQKGSSSVSGSAVAFQQLLHQLGDDYDSPVDFQLPDWLKKPLKAATPYTSIRRSILFRNPLASPTFAPFFFIAFFSFHALTSSLFIFFSLVSPSIMIIT